MNFLNYMIRGQGQLASNGAEIYGFLEHNSLIESVPNMWISCVPALFVSLD